ncbi:MAG: DUF6484 domain-containing protein [Pseudomonadota bacterium]
MQTQTAHPVPLPETDTRPRPTTSSNPLPSVTLGTLADISPTGQPLVHWPTSLSHAPVPARSQIPVSATDQGRECTLVFANGDPTQPILLGLLQPLDTTTTRTDNPVQIQSDQSIQLQAGQARLELHADGRILLQGRHIRSQAYGPNHLVGAAIKLN